MYWNLGTKRITTPTFPLCVVGENYDTSLTLTTDSGEVITNAYLFVIDSNHHGYIQAKLSTEADYAYLGIPFDTECYFGYIGAASSITIDFRMAFPPGTADGDFVIPVAVGHDDNAALPNPYFSRSWPILWHDTWPDLWADSWD